MDLFCFFDRFRCKGIKGSIAAYNKLCNPIFYDMALNFCLQCRIDFIWCIPVTNKKTTLLTHIPYHQPF